MSALQSKIAEAMARRDSAKGSLSEGDRVELEQRAELARINQEADEELERARGLAIDRALEETQERLGANVKLLPVVIKGFDDWFIVRGDAKAHARWTNGIQNSSQPDQQIDRNALSRTYALATVENWTGIVRTEDPDLTTKLSRFLTDNPGAATAITTAAAELVGLMTVSRKS